MKSFSEIGSDVLHLSDVAGDLGASGSARDEPDVPLLVDDDGRDHGREGSLPGNGKVVGRGREAEAVRDAGIRKIVHLVVQYYSRGRREYLGSKAGGERRMEKGKRFSRIWIASFYNGVTHKRLTVLVTATASPLGPMTEVWDVP